MTELEDGTEILPTFFTPKVFRLLAQGCEALRATLGLQDKE